MLVWTNACSCVSTTLQWFRSMKWFPSKREHITLHIYYYENNTHSGTRQRTTRHRQSGDTCLSFHLQLVWNSLSILLILCKIILYFSDRLQLPATHSVVLKSVFLSVLRLITFSKYLFAHRNVLTTWIHNKIDRKNTNQNCVFDQREIERPSPLVGFPFSRFLLEFSVLLLLIWTPHTIHRHHFFFFSSHALSSFFPPKHLEFYMRSSFSVLILSICFLFYLLCSRRFFSGVFFFLYISTTISMAGCVYYTEWYTHTTFK